MFKKLLSGAVEDFTSSMLQRLQYCEIIVGISALRPFALTPISNIDTK